MTLRLHVPGPQGVPGALAPGTEFALPAAAARHVQVRRLQPGDALVLFDGAGLEADAAVLAIGRREVSVRVLGVRPALARELPFAVTLAFGMPANERMDALVEKATELGVAALQPLHTARSVLRLDGERAARRQAHWQAVAAAASEQCGRAVVPAVGAVRSLSQWLGGLEGAGAASAPAARWLLSTDAAAPAWAVRAAAAPAGPTVVLSGPEGGFEAAESAAAVAAGFVPVSLGPRVLRADTAPLAALAALALAAPAPAAAA
ncbi:MAG: 16S rRNA (uracil(1498)-N(3))-methyltransferase [Pseudomonadota bacterium]